jgi:hypothetical protein
LLTCATVAAVQLSGQAPVIRDSAGIRIVENSHPRWTPSQTPHLASAPSLVIGTQPGEAYELSHVAGALRLSDHRIVVGDGGSSQLRFYDAEGTFLRSIGRHGDGPGEFAGLSQLSQFVGDSIVAGSATRLSVFTAAGVYARRVDAMIPPVTLPVGEPMIQGLFAGGTSIIGSIPHPMESGHHPAAGMRWIDTIHLALFDRHNTSLKTLAALPARMLEWQGLDLLFVGFSPQLLTASTGRRWFAGFGSEYSVRVYRADGQLAQIIRRQWDPEPVDYDAWTRLWLKSDDTLTASEAAIGRAALRKSSQVSALPAFAALIADHSGRLWVRESQLADWVRNSKVAAMSSRWNVFAVDGQWLGVVAMPPRFTPTDIGPDYVLGVARDGDGVESVQLYPLRI